MPPPPDGTRFSTQNEVTGMIYLSNDIVFGVAHLSMPAHNAVYECIYGGSGQGFFMRPFTPIADCLQ